jgi:hypothetical protein
LEIQLLELDYMYSLKTEAVPVCGFPLNNLYLYHHRITVPQISVPVV